MKKREVQEGRQRVDGSKHHSETRGTGGRQRVHGWRSRVPLAGEGGAGGQAEGRRRKHHSETRGTGGKAEGTWVA